MQRHRKDIYWFQYFFFMSFTTGISGLHDWHLLFFSRHSTYGLFNPFFLWGHNGFQGHLVIMEIDYNCIRYWALFLMKGFKDT